MFSAFDGPLGVYGNLANIPAGTLATLGEPDPNADAGPSLFYQWSGLFDPRIIYPKDKVTGYWGSLQGFLPLPLLRSISQIPAQTASNNIAAAQNATSGTALTLAAASTGIVLNIPIRPFSAILRGNAPVVAPLVMDYGFGFGNCTANSTTIQVSASTLFMPGMPLCIAAVGNGAGTAALLTNVNTIVDATHITVFNAPVATNSTAAIGTGDIWGPYGPQGFPTPQAAFPFFASGPGLFLDGRQSVARAVRITGASGGAGGSFTVSGWDNYWQPMTQTVTVGAGAVAAYSTKCFKAINTVTPAFTDAHNYSVGTADVFEFMWRSPLWEETIVFWAGTQMTSATGWVAGDTTAPATAATGDVRGTIQVSTTGGGSGIGSTASNGTISSLAMSGNRLEMSQRIGVVAMLTATQANPVTLTGQTQV